MSDDITNLMQQVYDYFLNLYQQAQAFTTETQDTFLTFEPVGTPIQPGMFKLHTDDPTYSPTLATEVFSTLANIVPAINADVFQPTGKTVDDFYTLLLNGSQPVPQSDDSLFSALKRQALQSFDQMVVGSLQGPFQYHPAYAMPTDWYDSSVAANWTPYSFSSGTPPPAEQHPPQNYIPIKRRVWEWRVPADEAAPVLQHPALLEQLSVVQPAPGISNQLRMAALSFDAEGEQPAKSGGSLGMDMVSANRFSPALTSVNERVIPTEQLSTTIAASTSDTMIAPAERFTTVATNPAIFASDATSTSAQAGDFDQTDNSAVIAVQRPVLMQAKLTEIVDTAQSAPVQSPYLNLSLNYCLVRINRPWFSQAFLTTRDWFMPGFASGDIAHGTAANSNDPFPALPVACLLVKDLQITADWSEISRVGQQAAAFGPFALVGQTTNQTTSSITAAGMQIIGWICQIMPVLPPAADPSVATSSTPATSDNPSTTPDSGTTSSASATPPADANPPAINANPPAATTDASTASAAPTDGATPGDGPTPNTQTTN